MKLLRNTAWFSTLKAWRTRRPTEGADPAEMGTAFGLDSITVIDSKTNPTTVDPAATPASDWQRRLTRRSGL